MSISSDSEKIFDIIYRIGGEKVDFYPLSSSENRLNIGGWYIHQCLNGDF
jgi:hypothetical protein